MSISRDIYPQSAKTQISTYFLDSYTVPHLIIFLKISTHFFRQRDAYQYSSGCQAGTIEDFEILTIQCQKLTFRGIIQTNQVGSVIEMSSWARNEDRDLMAIKLVFKELFSVEFLIIGFSFRNISCDLLLFFISDKVQLF